MRTVQVLCVCFLLVLSGAAFAQNPDDVVFNEILADPDDNSFIPTWSSGYDDIADYGTSEMVELLNRTGADVDISGWRLSTTGGTFFTFPGAPGSNTTVLGPGERVIVHAGGIEIDSPDAPLSVDRLVGVGGSSTLLVYDQAFEIPGPIMGLTNGSMTVSLTASPSAVIVDQVSWGANVAGEAAGINGTFFNGNDWGDDVPGIRVNDGNIGAGNGNAWVENNVQAPALTVLRDNVQVYPQATLRSRQQRQAGTIAGPIVSPAYSEAGVWADVDALGITNIAAGEVMDPPRGLPLQSNESRRTVTAGSTATFAPSAPGASPEFQLPSPLGIYEVCYIYPDEVTAPLANDPLATVTVASVNEGAVVEPAPQEAPSVAGRNIANEEFRPTGNYLLSSATAAATITAGAGTAGTFAAAVRFRQLQDDTMLMRSPVGPYLVDGNIAPDWYMIPPGGIDLGHPTGQIQRSRTKVVTLPGMAAQLINRDDRNDDTGSMIGDAGGYFYPWDASFSPANNDCDIDELRFAWDIQGLRFMLKLQDIQTPWVPIVCMTFDLDGINGSGGLFYGGFADCVVSPGLAWERQLVFNGPAGPGDGVGGTAVDLWNTAFVDVSTPATIVLQDTPNAAYEGLITWADMGFMGYPTTGERILVTCAVGLADFGSCREPGVGPPTQWGIGGGLSSGSDDDDPDFFDLAFGSAYPQLLDLSNARGPFGGSVNVSQVRNSFGMIIFENVEVPAELSVFTTD